MLSDEAKWKEYYNTKAAQTFWADFGAARCFVPRLARVTYCAY